MENLAQSTQLRRLRLRESSSRPIRETANGGSVSRTRRTGMIFITALWVTIVLSALVLVFARSMQVETIAAANRSTRNQVSAIERGAEQYVLSQVDNTDGDTSLITSAAAEAMQVGNGYFWIIRPDPDDVNAYDYGITDEASKLSINTAAVNDMMFLPNMTTDVADSIVDWRDADENVTDQGAESQYYRSLPEPYRSKNAPFETVEELMLVKNVTKDLLFGADRNHNGIIDDAEQQAAGNLPTFGGATSPIRGIFPYITCYTVEPNTDSTGAARVNVNGNAQAVTAASGARTTGTNAAAQPAATPAPTGGNNPGAGDASNAIRTALQNGGISSGRITQILGRYQSAPKPFASVFDFATKVGMTSTELAKVIDSLTTVSGTTIQGLVNVNTAPLAVLMCLPGLEESDAQAIITKRDGADTSNMAWMMDALTPQKLGPIGSRITGRSFQYSADIVAVSHDGRAFKRVRIVIDARNTPPKIIYRRDLTSLGWPLPQQIRDQLRSGKQLQTGNGTVGNAQGSTAAKVQM